MQPTFKSLSVGCDTPIQPTAEQASLIREKLEQMAQGRAPSSFTLGRTRVVLLGVFPFHS
jgi:hypothetical protein